MTSIVLGVRSSNDVGSASAGASARGRSSLVFVHHSSLYITRLCTSFVFLIFECAALNLLILMFY